MHISGMILPLSMLLWNYSHTTCLAANTPACPCGWRLKDPLQHFTHRIINNFVHSPDVVNILTDPQASSFTAQWLVNGYKRNSENAATRLDEQFDTRNVMLKDGNLVLKQRAYTAADAKARKPVSVSGLQSRELDILHGTFRTTMSIQGATGGAVASFFWYHSDTSEIDVEIVTHGTSIVNNTINYTSHPSTFPNTTPIPGATHIWPLPNGDFLSAFHEHRIDCSPEGVKYYLDSQPMHQDSHSIPARPGSIQLSLWADGNRFWSGIPSTTDVSMRVQELLVYYNTSSSHVGSDKEWLARCEAAGGASVKTICVEEDRVHMDKGFLKDSSGVLLSGASEARDRLSRLLPVLVVVVFVVIRLL